MIKYLKLRKVYLHENKYVSIDNLIENYVILVQNNQIWDDYPDLIFLSTYLFKSDIIR